MTGLLCFNIRFLDTHIVCYTHTHTHILLCKYLCLTFSTSCTELFLAVAGKASGRRVGRLLAAGVFTFSPLVIEIYAQLNLIASKFNQSRAINILINTLNMHFNCSPSVSTACNVLQDVHCSLGVAAAVASFRWPRCAASVAPAAAPRRGK